MIAVLVLVLLVVVAVAAQSRVCGSVCGAGDANGLVPRAIAAVRACFKREGRLISPAERYRGGRHSSYRRLQEGRGFGPKKKKPAAE